MITCVKIIPSIQTDSMTLSTKSFFVKCWLEEFRDILNCINQLRHETEISNSVFKQFCNHNYQPEICFCWQMLYERFQHWECKLIVVLFMYSVASSMMWIFMEGLYLHMLVHKTLFTERNGIRLYVMFGWREYY